MLRLFPDGPGLECRCGAMDFAEANGFDQPFFQVYRFRIFWRTREWLALAGRD